MVRNVVRIGDKFFVNKKNFSSIAITFEICYNIIVAKISQ